jgi:hypothetical protein
MNWFWMNVPLMVVFFAAMTGIPLWLTLRRPDTGPVAVATADPGDFAAIVAELLAEDELDENELVGAH